VIASHAEWVQNLQDVAWSAGEAERSVRSRLETAFAGV
jgi:glutamate dehydrogenase/leucine dehydrogenase